MLLRSLLVCVLLLTAVPTGLAEERELADRAALFPASSLFLLELDGSFRTRGEFWQDVHLGLSPIPNEYGVYPQVSGQDQPAGVRESADFRFRLKPTIHVGEHARIRSVVDLFALQAGEGGYSDVALSLRQGMALAPPGDIDSPLNSAYVYGLWAELDLFHLVTVQAGRIPAHWGLGLVENNGEALDADGGDYLDGIAVKADLPWDLQVALSFDYALEGRVVGSATAPWGVGHDPGDLDDILQFRLTVTMAPEPDAAGSFWSWGIYNRVRWQDYSSLGPQSPYEECQLYPWAPGFGCNELYWRDAFMWTPDAWFKGALAVAPDVHLTLDVELAGRYGSLSGTRFVPESSKRTLYGLGGVLRTAVKTPRLRVGVEVGGATGDDDSLAFGILDDPLIGEPDSAGVGTSESANATITSFALHANFHADQILFRRVVGAVTNALYVKPEVRFVVWQNEVNSLWLDASAMYATALVASAAPGEENPLGVETNLGLGADFGEHVQLRLDGALLVPLAGLKEASGLEDPLPWTTRLLLNFSF